jgi:hypothetical protein
MHLTKSGHLVRVLEWVSRVSRSLFLSGMGECDRQKPMNKYSVSSSATRDAIDYRSHKTSLIPAKVMVILSGRSPIASVRSNESASAKKNLRRKPPELRPSTVSSRSKSATIGSTLLSAKPSKNGRDSSVNSSGAFDATHALSLGIIKEFGDGTFCLTAQRFGLRTAILSAKQDHLNCKPLLRRLQRAGLITAREIVLSSKGV